jgi:hypothetical protein
VLDIQSVLKSVGEDSGDFNFITWSGSIDVVAE